MAKGSHGCDERVRSSEARGARFGDLQRGGEPNADISRGGREDRARASALYEKACNIGDEKACKLLRQLRDK
jgi:hypothetical protein